MQVFRQLKKEYVKSNMSRREAIYKKYGFKNEEDYLAFLEYKLKKEELRQQILNYKK